MTIAPRLHQSTFSVPLGFNGQPLFPTKERCSCRLCGQQKKSQNEIQRVRSRPKTFSYTRADDRSIARTKLSPAPRTEEIAEHPAGTKKKKTKKTELTNSRGDNNMTITNHKTRERTQGQEQDQKQAPTQK